MTQAKRIRAYWITTKVLHHELYAKLDLAYRRSHRGIIRQRARAWNANNKERRNMIRRLLYAQKKKEAEQSKS